jgi:7-cyano-7-deazaguanine synthase
VKKSAVVLLSGGLDSTTTLYWAISQGYKCHALIFDYSQRHRKEIKHAAMVARLAKIPYEIVKIKLPWKGSALLDKRIKVPINRRIDRRIPLTYVPARNMIFLSFALSHAEAIGAKAVFIGANAIDYSGYPDCRPAFFKAFQLVVKHGIKAKKIKVVAPLIKMTKKEIVKLGQKLGAPLAKTWSCYLGGRKPCGVCDSCRLREKGFSLYNRAK